MPVAEGIQDPKQLSIVFRILDQRRILGRLFDKCLRVY